MPQVVEEIPEALRPEVTAALAWLNAPGGPEYSLTALVDPEATISARTNDATPYELGLVLCREDLCVRERIAVRRAPSGFQFSLITSPPARGRVDGKLDPPAFVDPSPGARVGWLDEQLERYAFIVLVFYRGFW